MSDQLKMPPTKPILVVPSKKSLPPLPKIGSNRSLKLVSRPEVDTRTTHECPYYESKNHEFIWRAIDDFNKGICICGHTVTE